MTCTGGIFLSVVLIGVTCDFVRNVAGSISEKNTRLPVSWLRWREIALVALVIGVLAVMAWEGQRRILDIVDETSYLWWFVAPTAIAIGVVWGVHLQFRDKSDDADDSE
jgi:hypothetical protein